MGFVFADSVIPTKTETFFFWKKIQASYDERLKGTYSLYLTDRKYTSIGKYLYHYNIYINIYIVLYYIYKYLPTYIIFCLIPSGNPSKSIAEEDLPWHLQRLRLKLPLQVPQYQEKFGHLPTQDSRWEYFHP